MNIWYNRMKSSAGNTSNLNLNSIKLRGDYKMNDYIKFNEDRWNNVKNDYTEPLTHEELEEVRNNPISVALTVGKKVPKEWFEKANGKKIFSDIVICFEI